MGADSFIAFFGVRFELSEEEIEPCETKEDERIRRARKAKLDFCFDRPTDGEKYFLYVGRSLAGLGGEAEVYETLSEAQFLAVVSETKTRLTQAGISSEPSLHFQLIAQY
jgi:hypothetical protein